MKNNESLHITIKKPPDPNPVRSLASFDNPKSIEPQIIQSILSGVDAVPKSTEFEGNLKDEVLKLLSEEKVVAVQRQKNLTLVYFKSKHQ